MVFEAEVVEKELDDASLVMPPPENISVKAEVKHDEREPEEPLPDAAEKEPTVPSQGDEEKNNEPSPPVEPHKYKTMSFTSLFKY